MKSLFLHFRLISNMQPDRETADRMFAALVAGAEAACSRIRDVGGKHQPELGLIAVEKDLREEPTEKETQ